MAKIMQIKVSLNGIKPKIWRRILVEDSISFRELHETIQAAMGWDDYHHYEFEVGGKIIQEEGFNAAEGVMRTLHESEEFQKLLENVDMSKGHASLDVTKMNEILKKEKSKKKEELSVNTPLNKMIKNEGDSFSYLYDFGDNWRHGIEVEKITEKDDSKKYPLCIDGKRACPPEDCGGIYGYEELMKIRKNKKHPDYKERIVEWLSEDYDPEEFNLDDVNAMMHGGFNIEEIFVPLKKLLNEDNNSVKEIKTVHKKEVEYAEYLGAIEYSIATYFLQNRKLKDKDVEIAIKNIKKNYTNELNYFEDILEKGIMIDLSRALQEKAITHHELKLVFDYILLSIENRSWIGDKQAYVSWLPYLFKLYNNKESEIYKQNFIKKSKHLGIPEIAIKAMLN